LRRGALRQRQQPRCSAAPPTPLSSRRLPASRWQRPSASSSPPLPPPLSALQQATLSWALWQRPRSPAPQLAPQHARRQLCAPAAAARSLPRLRRPQPRHLLSLRAFASRTAASQARRASRASMPLRHLQARPPAASLLDPSLLLAAPALLRSQHLAPAAAAAALSQRAPRRSPQRHLRRGALRQR
jgi:hypothetical protein